MPGVAPLVAVLVVLSPHGHSPTAAGEWWSWKPLVRPPVPTVSPITANPIDAFVRRTLADKKLAPSPEADRRTLIRRLTFDLHGLPPTPDEVDAFVADQTPEAYEKLVDRLLASPRYGERWARHWLDTVHFADTQGFEHDVLRPNAWRYRDYVIDSFNRDTPWSRFVREQLAADALYPDRPDLTPALGFLGAGPSDLSAAGTAPKMFEYLDRDDVVTQTMTAFASTTANCARCHDHKFDPVSQEDYFALQAVFAGVARGELKYDADPAVGLKRLFWERAKTAAETGTDEAVLAAEFRPPVTVWEAALGEPARWTLLTPQVFVSAEGSTLTRQADGSVVATGTRPDRDAYTLTFDPPAGPVTAVRLDVLPSPTLPALGPGRSDNGNFHLSEFELNVFPPGATQAERVKVRRAVADFDQDKWTAAHATDGDPKTAWGVHPKVGEPHHAVFELDARLTLSAGTKFVALLRQTHGSGHVIGRFKLSTTEAPPSRLHALSAAVEEALRTPAAERSTSQRAALARVALRERAGKELAALPAQRAVFAAQHLAKPKEVRLLKRGDIDKPGEVVGPGALAEVTAVSGRFPANDGATRRAALADWLVAGDNPLSWRSIVNRVWHYHFGRGICDSPNDLGRMGGTPSHPELLDWLAAEFRNGGGSLKKLHRLIVTSMTYRQRSDHRPDAATTDSENRWLWRMNRIRLDADQVRDAVLFVSGKLNPAMGGPGVEQFRTSPGPQSTPKLDYDAVDWNNPSVCRRSIYRVVWRNVPDPFLDALDFPDLGMLAPARGFSASPLQALALFNNRFVLHHCDALAARVGPDADKVAALFRIVLQRPPTADERSGFAQLIEQHGPAAAARVLFNGSEFLFVD